MKTKSAIHTLEFVNLLDVLHKFIIKVFLSKFCYTQAPGDLGQLSGGPTTHHPAQQLRGPLAHGGFYGVEGHFKPELDRTLNNEHLFLI